MIGIGFLTFPKLCDIGGLVNTLVLIVLCGIMGCFSTFLLIRAYHIRSDSESYPELVKNVLGINHFRGIAFCLLCYITFSTTFYIFFCSLILKHVYQKIFPGRDISLFAEILLKFCLAAFGWFLNIFKLQKIRSLGYIANFFSLSLGLILIFQLPSRYNSILEDPKIELFKFSPRIFEILGNILFAFVNQFSVITIIKILKEDSSSIKYQV